MAGRHALTLDAGRHVQDRKRSHTHIHPSHPIPPSPQKQDTASTAYTTVRKSGVMVMRERKCELLGKRANRQARLVSFSHIRSKTSQGVNLHEKRVWWAEGSKFVRLRLSTKGWRTVKKYGLNKAFAKFGIDLHQFQAQH